MFYNDQRLQVYIYAFMYVDREKISLEDQFPATGKICCELQENVKSSSSTKKLAWI